MEVEAKPGLTMHRSGKSNRSRSDSGPLKSCSGVLIPICAAN